MKAPVWGQHAGCPYHSVIGIGRKRYWVCSVAGETIKWAYADCTIRKDDERVAARDAVLAEEQREARRQRGSPL